MARPAFRRDCDLFDLHQRRAASWIEHLRQHERVTNADRLQEEVVLRFHLAGEPKVTHFIAAEP